jgi:hypothetical protein
MKRRLAALLAIGGWFMIAFAAIAQDSPFYPPDPFEDEQYAPPIPNPSPPDLPDGWFCAPWCWES